MFSTTDESRRGHSHSQTLLIGGGFAAGMLIGGWVIFGSDAGAEDSVGQSSPEQAVTDVAGTASPSAGQSPAVSDLEMEKLRLSVELEKAKLEKQLAELKLEQARAGRAVPQARDSGSSQPARSAAPGAGPSFTSKATTPGERTLEFWNQMNQIIRSEAAMRSAPNGGVTALNAGSFVNSRIQAGEFAVDAFKQLDTDKVDAAVVSLANDVRTWYENGVRVSQKAQQLLGADASVRQGAGGMGWRAEEQNHNAAVKQVNARGARVRQQMIAKYKLPFPPLE